MIKLSSRLSIQLRSLCKVQGRHNTNNNAYVAWQLMTTVCPQSSDVSRITEYAQSAIDNMKAVTQSFQK